MMIRFAILATLVNLFCPALHAETLQPQPAVAFDKYVRGREIELADRDRAKKDFPWMDTLPQAERDASYAALERGEILARQAGQTTVNNGTGSAIAVPGGLIHDWVGAVFIPGATVTQTVRVLEDYDHDCDYYAPQVLASKLVSRSGNDLRAFLRLKRVAAITVILDTEYDVHTTFLDKDHAAIRSRSTRIREVEHAGEARERALPAGEDHGFLWRLNTYWQVSQTGRGVFLECEAISLTRPIPPALAWLVEPFVRDIPEQSLRFALEATRKAVEREVGVKSTDW
jgi:hypothetical protein